MNQDPLAQLRDIHLPDPISIWPPAIGWWLLLVIIMLLAVAVGWAIKRHLANRKRQLMINNELDNVLANYKLQGDFQTYLQALSELLKRAAISLREDKQVAAYSGKEWQQYISQYTSPDQKDLCHYFGDNLYQRKGSGDVPALQKFAKDWINAKKKTEVNDAQL
jgi:uncharacterized membrane-anchored protein YhcB (DUF1043 family)